MKKIFEKHDLFKIVGIGVLLTVLLTWIVKAGSFNGTEITVSEFSRIGLNDFFTYGLLSLYYFAIIVTLILIVGGFYEVLAKTKGYQTLVTKLTKFLKGKEIPFVLIVSFIIAAIISISNEYYQIIIFLPFIVTLILKLKQDKIVAFNTTFGSVLIGIIGATYSPVVFEHLNQYLSTVFTTQIFIKILLFFITYILFNFFTIMRIVKNKANKELEEEVDVFEVKEEKKAKIWPFIVVFSVLLVFQIVGYISWANVFKVTFFTDLHSMVTGLTLGNVLLRLTLGVIIFGLIELIRFIVCRIKKKNFKWQLAPWILISLAILFIVDILNVAKAFDLYSLGFVGKIASSFAKVGKETTIVSYILGTSAAIGTWDLYAIQMLILLATAIIAIISKLKFNDVIESMATGAKKMLKPIIILLLIYIICIFSVMYPFMPTIVNAITGISSKFNVYLTSLSALIASIFGVEMRYIATSLVNFFATVFGNESNNPIIMLVFQSMYGFVQFFAPTSLFLMLGLSYLDIKYKDWLKYIWMFLAGLFIIIMIILTLITYVL